MRAAALAVILVACGGDDGPATPRDAAIDAPDPLDAPTDAPVLIDAPVPANAGFTMPTAPLEAWRSNGNNTYTAQPLDLSCLGMARNDPATTVTVSLTAAIRDFQSNNLLPTAGVTAFGLTNPSLVLASGTSDSLGNVTLSIPSNNKRIGFALTHANARPTYSYDHLLAPSAMSQTTTLFSMSNATAATLPALIGQTAMANTAIVIARVHDCQGHELSNFIATASTTAMVATHATNATTFYFSDAVDLPVRHTQAPHGTRNGLYMIIDVPPLATAYIQVWGYRNAAELSSNTLTRIAEIAIPLTANSATILDQEPHATN